MESYRILVIEDDPAIGQSLLDGFRQHGFRPELQKTGSSGVEYAQKYSPHLILLDIRLPDGSGFDVCRQLRSLGLHQPIIMLTAQHDELDKVLGLEMGADDYMTKPFSPRELDARVKALLRRGPVSSASDGPALFYRGERLVVDFDAVAISVDGTEIRLTRREFELLRCLVQNRNRVLSRDRLLERVWGESEMETRSVDVHVGRLRAKLGAASRHIETVVGLGYRFVD